MPHTETKLESKEIFDGHKHHVTLDTVRLEDGRTSLRGSYTTTAAPACCPSTTRTASIWSASSATRWARRSGELPAGKLEPGEDPFESAKRELSEECGLSADNYIDLGSSTPLWVMTARRFICGPPPACTRAVSTWMPGNSWMWCACLL